MAIQGIRILNPWFLEQDAGGLPAAGYLVWTLEAGSVDTLVDTYLDKDLLTKNTNPVILNLKGEANIFTDLAQLKMVFTAPGADLTSPIWTQDYVDGILSATTAEGAATGTANNIYHVNTVPAYASIPDGLSLVMIPDVSNQDTLIAKTFTGTGINDPVFSGPYVGSTASIFSIQIDATPGGTDPDTFKWQKDGGAWTTGVPVTTSLQVLEEGFAVIFSEVQGHVVNDLWTYSVRPPAYLDFCGLGADIIYKSVDQVLVALSAGDIIAGIPAHMDWSASQSCWILLNPSQPVLATQIPQRQRKEIIADYNVLVADQGKELSCNGTFTVTLPSCTDAVNKFFYINNVGTGIITVETAGGTDVIILPGETTGLASIGLEPGKTWYSIQLETNGANWHLMTATSNLHGAVLLNHADTWTCPPGVLLIEVTGSAGGGGGGQAGVGGEAGEYLMMAPVTVVPGTIYTASVGVGGLGSGTGGNPGTDGGDTFMASGGILFYMNGGVAGADTGAINVPTGAPVFWIGGAGGSNPFGVGGRGGMGPGGIGGVDDVLPEEGSGYGAGGGGSAGDGSDGANGADGFLRIRW